MIKLLLGGSPCTHWSIAKSRNRETKPSGIGWELFLNYVIALRTFKPDYFLYENNKSMAPAIKEQITKELGVEPILINSSLVSAQNRNRLYWTNIPGVQHPEDKGILLYDVLEPVTNETYYALKSLSIPEMLYQFKTSKGRNHFDFCYHNDSTKDKSSCVTANISKGVSYNVLVQSVRLGTIENNARNPNFDSKGFRVYSPFGKSTTLCGCGGGQGAKTGLYMAPFPDCLYKVHPVYEVRNGLLFFSR